MSTLDLLSSEELTLVDETPLSIDVKGRNSRKPKKANHGARPCSSYMRRLKKKGWVNPINGGAD